MSDGGLGRGYFDAGVLWGSAGCAAEVRCGAGCGWLDGFCVSQIERLAHNVGRGREGDVCLSQLV